MPHCFRLNEWLAVTEQRAKVFNAQGWVIPMEHCMAVGAHGNKIHDWIYAVVLSDS